jgi:hypothetical protein
MAKKLKPITGNFFDMITFLPNEIGFDPAKPSKRADKLEPGDILVVDGTPRLVKRVWRKDYGVEVQVKRDEGVRNMILANKTLVNVEVSHE